MKFVIVEDNVDQCEYYRLLFAKVFPEVELEIYTEAKPAYKRVLKNSFDLLITDVNIDNSGINGFKLARCAYSVGKPVLIITGTDFIDKTLFFTNNIDMIGRISCISKPAQVDNIVKKVNSLLKKGSLPLHEMYTRISAPLI